MSYRTIEWVGDIPGHVRLLDQTLLPGEVRYHDCHTVEEVWEAIRSLRVRGAPAIGIAVAMGVVLGVQKGKPSPLDRASFIQYVGKTADKLRTSRPTAVNLFWALDRMERRARAAPQERMTWEERGRWMLPEALAIEDEDRAMCRAIGAAGDHLIGAGQGVLTHCNAGGLATSDYGTALAVMFTAAERGTPFHVYADETRPLLQGSRLTAWELMQRNIPVTLICDSVAASVMRSGRVHLIITGADRIAANGDAANKIGTYGVALLAKAHGIPFYVAAPSSTFDLSLPNGDLIPIEERDPREVTHGFGPATAPAGVKVYNPAFDVTPAELITALITERGLVRPVDAVTIRQVLGDRS